MLKLSNFRLYKLKVLWQSIVNSRKPVRTLCAYLLIFSGLNRFFTINLGGYKINFSSSSVASAFFVDGNERGVDEDFLMRTLKESDIFVDVGANIGTLTLLGSTLCKKGKVFSFEAHPETFAFLEKNIQLNEFNNIETFNCAVGKEDGYVFFTDAGADDLNKVVFESKGIKIPVKKLDNIITGINISLMKIDVEGFEKFVLEGAINVLQHTDAVYFESWENHFSNYNYCTGDLIALFKQYNFKVYKLLHDHLVELNLDYTSTLCENLVALRNTGKFILKTGFRLNVSK